MTDESEVQNLLSEARISFENGEFKKSLSLCYKAYEINACPKLLRKIERIKPFADREDEQSASSSPSTPVREVACYLYQQGCDARNRGDLAQALKLLKESHECFPSDKTVQMIENVEQMFCLACKSEEIMATSEELLRQAKDLYSSGELQDCLHLLQRIHIMDPSDKIGRKIERIRRHLKEEKEEISSTGNVVSTEIVDVASGFSVPRVLFEKLYSYQQDGVRWLWRLHNTAPGGVLADDMGLGKTVQVIAFLSGLFLAKPRHFTALIIMPVSVLVTWEGELKKWAPTLRVSTFHDNGRIARLRQLSVVQRQGGILLTTYGTVAKSVADLTTDVNADPNFLRSDLQSSNNRTGPEFVWNYLILDEAHKIKNPAAKTTKSILSISADHRILLTGTAVQNNLQELWSLYNCAHSGRLLGRMQTFKMEYEKPITRAREKDANRAERAHGQLMAQSLRKLIDPYFLRRTKAEILPTVDKDPVRDGVLVPTLNKSLDSLPKKTELVVWLYLRPVQERSYRDFLQLDQIKELLLGSTRRSPLMELVILKKLCDHPRLLSTDQCASLHLESAQPSCNSDQGRFLPSATQLIDESGKLLFLSLLMDSFLEEMISKSTIYPPRCLIFSQSIRFLDMAEKVILALNHMPENANRLLQHRVLRLDGRLSKVEDRLNVIRKFENDKSYTVMLLTTQVGGVGLTLTSANRVVILDPSWNPATDAQAVDRAYRIGQKSDVIVYRLITCGTVEEKIYRRQIFKDSVIRQTTSTGQNKSDVDPYRYFTRQDLRELFSLSDPRVSKTQEHLANLHSDGDKWIDETLRPHLLYLTSEKLKHTVFGLSFHDLMFTKSEVSEQYQEATAGEQQFLLNRLLAAEHAISRECADATGPLAHNFTSLHVRDKPCTQLPLADNAFLIPSQLDTKRPMFNRPQLGSRVVSIPYLPSSSDVPGSTELGDATETDASTKVDPDQLTASFKEMSISHKTETVDSPDAASTAEASSSVKVPHSTSDDLHNSSEIEQPNMSRKNSSTDIQFFQNSVHMDTLLNNTPSPPSSCVSFGHSVMAQLPRSTPLSVRNTNNSPLIPTPILRRTKTVRPDTFQPDVLLQYEALGCSPHDSLPNEELIQMDITIPIDDVELGKSVNMKSMQEILSKSGLLGFPGGRYSDISSTSKSLIVVEDSYISAGRPNGSHVRMDELTDNDVADIEIIEDSLT